MISEFELPDEDIDWDVVKSRLKELQHAVVRSKELSPEDTDALLEERARALARVPDATDAGSLLESYHNEKGNEITMIKRRE